MHHIQRFAVGAVVLVLLLVMAACVPAASEPAPAAEAPVAEVEVTEMPPAEEAPTDEPAEEVEPAAESSMESDAAASEGPITFQIDPAQSSVRFILDEVLRGQPTTVVGEGSGISGDVTVDVANPSATAIGPITIDARSLETDNGMRNQAIGRFILQHNQDDFQYITFTPTAIDGLPESAAVGEEMSFAVTGDLTIRTVTQPVTFDVTVVPESETILRGSGQTQVLRSDFDLQIPNVPSVANVTDEVQLEIDFVAVAQ